MKPGTRVRMTPEAIRQGLQGRVNRRTGVYVGEKRGLMRVLRDGEKRSQSWSRAFWGVDE